MNQGVVELKETLTCNGRECEVDSPRIIEVEAGLYYEYTRPPCVEQSFFENGVMLKTISGRYFCSNPRLETGTVGCCRSGSNRADVSSVKFDGELVKSLTASQRCSALNLGLCDDPWWSCSMCDINLGFWTKRTCDPMAKINIDGKVAIVHKATGVTDPSRILNTVREDTKTYFRVEWFNGVEYFLQSYETSCANLGCTRDFSDNLCVCPTNVSEEVVFRTKPTREQVLEQLSIGAFVPENGQLTATNLGGGVIMHSKDAQYTEATIFEVVDDNGTRHFRKNIRSIVSLGNCSTPLSFRNPPHFISIGYPEIRDAAYETEAGLDHYFVSFNEQIPIMPASVTIVSLTHLLSSLVPQKYRSLPCDSFLSTIRYLQSFTTSCFRNRSSIPPRQIRDLGRIEQNRFFWFWSPWRHRCHGGCSFT
jgi:hypothetical protein